MNLKNKIACPLFCSIAFLAMVNGALVAQGLPMEEIVLSTDRDLYIAGEQVHFKLYTLDAASGELVHYSDIVYLELLDRQHPPLVRKKFTIWGGESNGTFTLPLEMVSDNYSLRAYTSWMKNAGAAGYAHHYFTIINPFAEVAPWTIPPDDNEGNNIIAIPDHDNDLPAESSGLEIVAGTDRNNYGARQKISLEINTYDDTGNPVEASLSLSVARTGLIKAENRFTNPHADQYSGISEVLYPPEWGGHYISGNITHRSKGYSFSEDTLLFSVAGRRAILNYSIADSLGNFSLFAPIMEGYRDLVIQNLNPSKTDYQIRLEDPFSDDFFDIQIPAFHIDTSHLSKINQAVITAQIDALYAEKLTATDPGAPGLSFYGHPELEVMLADYIRLPEMREVFFELVPAAMMRGRGDQTSLRVKDVSSGMISQSGPLLLVDGVVTPSALQIAELDPLKVERIDVLSSDYYYGVLHFPGMVSVFTEDGRCPLTFPEHYFRQYYEFVSTLKKVEFPDYSVSSNLEDPRVDLRNTLYWDPEIHTDENGHARIEFYTSDDISEYVLRVDGITSGGLAGSYSTIISVGNER